MHPRSQAGGHTVLWQNGTVTTLSSTLGSLQDVFCFGMNNNGQFVGQGTTSSGTTVGSWTATAR
jgi:hypothetical protein